MKHKENGSKTVEKAFAEYRAGDYESALLLLAGATVDEDDYLDLAYLLGLCYMRLARYEEALLYLEQIVTSGEQGARTNQCRFALAIIYSRTGRVKLAEYELKKLLADQDETAQLCSAMGYASWEQGRKDEALLWYKKAVQKDPSNINAMNGYGYVLACMEKDLPNALSFCQKACQSAPNNPAYADSLGWVYFKIGNKDLAEHFVLKAAKTMPENKEIKNHLSAIGRAVS